MITFEPITGIIRAGKNHTKYGDEYEVSAHVTLVDDIALVFVRGGGAKEIDISVIREIGEYLKNNFNIKIIKWDRYKKGKKKQTIKSVK